MLYMYRSMYRNTCLWLECLSCSTLLSDRGRPRAASQCQLLGRPFWFLILEHLPSTRVTKFYPLQPFMLKHTKKWVWSMVSRTTVPSHTFIWYEYEINLQGGRDTSFYEHLLNQLPCFWLSEKYNKKYFNDFEYQMSNDDGLLKIETYFF